MIQRKPIRLAELGIAKRHPMLRGLGTLGRKRGDRHGIAGLGAVRRTLSPRAQLRGLGACVITSNGARVCSDNPVPSADPTPRPACDPIVTRRTVCSGSGRNQHCVQQVTITGCKPGTGPLPTPPPVTTTPQVVPVQLQITASPVNVPASSSPLQPSTLPAADGTAAGTTANSSISAWLSGSTYGIPNLGLALLGGVGAFVLLGKGR